MNSNNIKEEEKGFDTEIIYYYLTYWKWILSSTAIAIFIACMYILVSNNNYKINTSILIKDDKDGGLSALALLSDLGVSGQDKDIDNESQIIKSADLIKKTILSTNYNISYTEHIGLKDLPVFPAPIQITPMSINLDTITSPISIKLTKSDKGYTIQAKYNESVYDRNISYFPCSINLPFGKFLIQREPTIVLGDNITAIVSNPDIMAVAISNDIVVEPSSKKSSIINISLISNHKEKGILFLNNLVDRYNSQAVEDKNQIANNTALFIEERLKSLTTELSNVEKNVEKYKTKNKITDISSEAELYINQSGESETKLKETETQLNIIKYVEGFINDEKNKDRLVPNLGITDPGLSALVIKYNELFLEKERIQKATTVNNPILDNINSQLYQMKIGIRNSIINVRKTLSIAKSDISQENNKTIGKIQQIPRIEREFIEIKRQQEIKQNLYLFLLQKREETNLTLAATAPQAKLISTPRPEREPVSPKRNIILLGALILGIIIPIAVIYIKDLLQTTVKNKEDLEKSCNAPILGELPVNISGSNIVVTPHDTSSTTELFRALRNDISFILNDPNKKVIMVTSTVPNEGKTFVGLNLASAFALIDKKIIIIGLDIRNPSLANYIGTKNKYGITSYLSMGGSIDELIQNSTLSPNLDIIYAGLIPPNPNELLNKQALDELFIELRKRYDYILIDTAPVGIISDTFLINRLSDMTLYVTRENVTNKNSILFINDLFENNKLNNIYLVLNGANIERKQYGHYRAGSYYGYYKKTEKKSKLSSFIDLISKQKK